MSTKPRAVRDAATLAETRFKEAYQSEDQRDAPDASAQQQPPQPAEPPADPQPPAPAEPPAPPAPPAEDWERKFRTLQGKYNAEVPRLQESLRTLSADKTALESRIEQLEQTLASLNEPATENPVASPEEMQEYGPELVSFMQRLAKTEAERVAQTVTPQIQQVQGQLEETRKQTAEERFYATLDAQVEDWRLINRDPEFLAWLDEEVPFTGATRKHLLGQYYQAGKVDGNASRVVAIFKGFASERRAPQPNPQPQPAATPAPPQPQVRLEDLAGPGRGQGGGTAPTEPGRPQPWTRAQIGEFYRDVHRGVYRNDPQRKAAIERSISEAQRAGLISA